MKFGQNGENNDAPELKLHINQCNNLLQVAKDNRFQYP